MQNQIKSLEKDKIYWHNLKPDQVLVETKTRVSGLTVKEAQKRLVQKGFNKLPESQPESVLKIFLHQFQSPLIYVLLGASVIFFLLGDYIDSFIVLAVLVFNAIIGAVQEGRAQNTLAALKNFIETKATVIRDGQELIVSDEIIVPGDIIVLQEGEKIPADARIIESHQLRLDESSLTGKSHPIHKSINRIEKDAPLSSQVNMVFKGTYILAGSGLAVVVATGINTIIGRISQEIISIETESPLKNNIKKLSRLIMIAFLAASLYLFFFAWLSGRNLLETFEVIVAFAVSVIPEGLPIVITLVLATGVWRMSKRQALVKRLQAVEALGEATVIAIDKTGTITKNELVVREIYANGQNFRVSGTGYSPQGKILESNFPIELKEWPEMIRIAHGSVLAGSARLAYLEEEDRWRVAGDPTEAALQVLARKMGLERDDFLREHQIVQKIPFEYQVKYQASVYQERGQKILSVVGAPEAILDFCTGYQKNGKRLSLTIARRKELESIFEKMAESGLRVLAFAEKKVSGPIDPNKMPSLDFLGFVGMRDAIRLEAARAVRKLQASGMRVVMITGDYETAARAVAQEANIFLAGDRSLSGFDIDAMSDEELQDSLDQVSVFARVTPEHKLRIIQAYRRCQEIVAMTGDGVNDAPSLVAADLGISMGRLGTEVAKEASDIILLDDNLESIVAAVEEGRRIYQSIRRVVLYLFATSLGEMMLIAVAFFLRYPLPLLAAQIIWLNVVTDGLLDMALAFEPKSKGLLKTRFYKSSRHLVDRLMGARILIMALPMVIGSIWLFSRYFEFDLVKAQTITLTAMAIFQWFNAWNCRSSKESVFRSHPFTNRYLVAALLAVIILQMLVVYLPWMQNIFRTTSLTIKEWAVIIGVSATVFIGEEIRKLFYRRRLVNLKIASRGDDF